MHGKSSKEDEEGKEHPRLLETGERETTSHENRWKTEDRVEKGSVKSILSIPTARVNVTQ